MNETDRSCSGLRRSISLLGSFLVVFILVTLFVSILLMFFSPDFDLPFEIMCPVSYYGLIFCTPVMQVMGVVPAWKKPLSDEIMERRSLILWKRIYLVVVYSINLFFIYFILFKFGPSWG